MSVRAVIDIVFFEERREALVVATRRRQNIAFDAVVAGNLCGAFVQGDLSDARSDRMAGDVAEGFGHRRDELLQERLGIVRPQVTRRFNIMILPIELRLALLLRHHLEKLAEHEVSAYGHEKNQYASPEYKEPHEHIVAAHYNPPQQCQMMKLYPI